MDERFVATSGVSVCCGSREMAWSGSGSAGSAGSAAATCGSCAATMSWFWLVTEARAAMAREWIRWIRPLAWNTSPNINSKEIKSMELSRRLKSWLFSFSKTSWRNASSSCAAPFANASSLLPKPVLRLSNMLKMIESFASFSAQSSCNTANPTARSIRPMIPKNMPSTIPPKTSEKASELTAMPDSIVI